MRDSSVSTQGGKTLSRVFCRHHRRGFGAEQRSGFSAACRKMLPDMREGMEVLEIEQSFHADLSNIGYSLRWSLIKF